MTDITTLAYYLNQIVLVLLWTYFFANVLPKRFHNGKDWFSVFVVISFYTVLALLLFNRPGSENDNSVVRLIVMEGLFLSGILLISHKNLKRTVQLFFIHQLLTLSGEILAMLAVQVWMYLFPVVTFEDANVNIAMYVVNDIICLFLYRVAVHRLTDKASPLNNRHTGIVLILVVGQFIWIYIVSYALVYHTVPPRALFITALIVQIICSILVFVLLTWFASVEKEKRKAAMAAEMHTELEQHVQYLGEKQKVLNEIYGELTEPNLETIEVLENARGQMKSIRNELYCDNASVNALLNYFKGICIQAGVELTVEMEGNIPSQMSDYDLNVLLSNLLKNAMQASASWIHLNMQGKGSLLFIQCANACDRKEERKKKKISGQGISIVKHMVKRYNGTFDFKREEDRVTVVVSLLV